MNLRDSDLVYLDVETTGIKPSDGHRICEIALIHTSGTSEIARFSSLVDPCRELDPEAAAVNGLTREMLFFAPAFCRIERSVRNQIAGRILVGWNVDFDLRHLWAEYGRLNAELPSIRTLDGIAIAKRFLPRQPNYRLETIARFLSVPESGCHRALADAETCRLIVHILLVRNAWEVPDTFIRSTY